MFDTTFKATYLQKNVPPTQNRNNKSVRMYLKKS